jgi:uncharacterized protein YfaS (alpha-2-macroglobulin family)
VDLAEPETLPDRRAHFYSAHRRRALELALLAEIFGPEPWVRSALTRIAGRLERASAWYTTQELAWTITAVGRFAGEAAAAPLPEARLLAGEKALAPASGGENAKGPQTWTVLRASEREGLRLELEPAENPPFVLLLSEGIRPDAKWRSGGEGLSVTRALLDASGEPVDGPVELGELVYSVVRVRNLGTRIEDVAVVDPFPAGFEAVNPRLTGVARPSWLDGQEWSEDYVSYLDDRAEVFGDLGRREGVMVWTPLRAVTAGPRQTHPPVTAEAMYAPEIWASALAAPVAVER